MEFVRKTLAGSSASTWLSAWECARHSRENVENSEKGVEGNYSAKRTAMMLIIHQYHTFLPILLAIFNWFLFVITALAITTRNSQFLACILVLSKRCLYAAIKVFAHSITRCFNTCTYSTWGVIKEFDPWILNSGWWFGGLFIYQRVIVRLSASSLVTRRHSQHASNSGTRYATDSKLAKSTALHHPRRLYWKLVVASLR